MRRRSREARTLVALLAVAGLYAAACGASLGSKAVTRGQPPAPATRVSTPPAAAAQSPEDPVLTLIAESNHHFKAGQKELELGHVEGAKQEFNRAVNVLLESSYGARTEPR